MNSFPTQSGPRLVIAGGSGFLGRALALAAAERGYEVVVLSRDERVRVPRARVVGWNGRTRGAWVKELEGAEALVNLAGRSVHCRYTREALREIDGSRVDSTRVLGDAVHGCVVPPRVWVQASSLAIYGDAGDRWCDEGAPLGEGVPVRTARRWERAFAESPTPRTRRVVLRMSFVLGRDAGVLATMARVVRWGVGGALGSGRQFVSWIHVADLMRVVLRVVDDPSMSGVYVASSPEPVRNAEFMGRLREEWGRPWVPRVPGWLVRFGCWLMGTEGVLALTGRRGDPRRLEEAGFTFRFPVLREALADVYGGGRRPEPAGVGVPGPVLAVKVR
jgi:uncharacterized protein (TIGR01777 family)